MAESKPAPMGELEADRFEHSVQRFTRDEVLAILTSDRALATHFLLASEPFAERQDQKEERRVEEVRLEAARVESNERRNSPERFVPVILNKLPGLDDEPIPVEDAERVHRRVEDAIRALMAHVVVPTSELDGASVLARLAKLDRAMNRTKGDGWRYPLVPITWDYVGALRLAVEAQRDRLEPLIERRRVASRLDGDFHAALDWEAIWHGYLHETTYDDHNQSLRQNPWNTHHQILRIPARCKLPSERSSSLLQSLPFELLSQIITASASDYIPHPKSSPDQAAALDTLRADRLRTLALIGPAWRNIAQRELIKRPLVGGVVGLGRFVSMLDKRKLGSLVRELHVDGGKILRGMAENVPLSSSQTGWKSQDLIKEERQAELDREFEKALAGKGASERTLWTSIVRLGETCRTLPSLRLSNLTDLKDVTSFFAPMQLQSLTLQSLDFPTKTIEIPSSIRTLSLLHIKFSFTSRILNRLRHLTPSRLDTLILLDCSTPDEWDRFNSHPNVSSTPGVNILESVKTLHLDATQTSAVFLQEEHLPAVTTLELFTVDRDSLDFVAHYEPPPPPPKVRISRLNLRDKDHFRPPTANQHRARLVLRASANLRALERLIIPDEKEWRSAWESAQGDWDQLEEREELALRVQALEVIWKE